MFYFKEGFCWIYTLNEHSEYQKCRIKEKSVNDVNAMALYPFQNIGIPSYYYVVLINSYFIFNLKKHFLNSSSAFQINDAKQLPIIIPDKQTLLKFKNIFFSARDLKYKQFSNEISKNDADKLLNSIQINLDELVETLYLTK